MIKRKYKNITFKLYTDAMEFANMKEKPLGEIPKGAKFSSLSDGAKSTGFATLEDKTIRLFIDEGCLFTDLLSTVSHEMGHLIEGGFKKNPPQKDRYFNKHEEKAMHYENFVMEAYHLTHTIMNEVTASKINQTTRANRKR